MGCSRQEYGSGLPSALPGDLPTRGSKPSVLHWQPDFPLHRPGVHGGKKGQRQVRGPSLPLDGWGQKGSQLPRLPTLLIRPAVLQSPGQVSLAVKEYEGLKNSLPLSWKGHGRRRGGAGGSQFSQVTLHLL